MKKLRGFENIGIRFDFPVTALIGPNGGGKTTILGAAALIYRSVKPRRFFAKSGRFDDSMQDWAIEYEIIDRDVAPRDSIVRTASYKSAKWSRDAQSRPVEVFGVSRTVPSTERVELSRYASGTFSVSPDKVESLEPEIASAVSKILGKDVTGYQRLRIDDKGRITLLTGKTDGGIQYSEFHFGAGESSVIRMVIQIEGLPENSLVLIEEIENGLHPVATIRMVEYLIDVALRKKAQAIFTTHSNAALNPLPDKAIWVAVSSRCYQGKLDVMSLRAITGQVEAKLAIFTEDLFSRRLIEAVMRTRPSIDFQSIQVHHMEGDGTAVAINRHHNQDPTARFASICFIDGDSQQEESENNKVYRLPGEMPETYIYDKVIDELDQAKGTLAVGFQLPFDRADEVAKLVRDVRLTNRDGHNLFSQVGERLGFLSFDVVAGAFLSSWCKLYPNEAQAIVDEIMQNIKE